MIHSTGATVRSIHLWVTFLWLCNMYNVDTNSMLLLTACIRNLLSRKICCTYDDVIKWKHFPCYWPFVRGIHRTQIDYPQQGQWHGALMFSLICDWNGWANNRDAGDLRRHRPHHYVTVMIYTVFPIQYTRCLVLSFVLYRKPTNIDLSSISSSSPTQ